MMHILYFNRGIKKMKMPNLLNKNIIMPVNQKFASAGGTKSTMSMSKKNYTLQFRHKFWIEREIYCAIASLSSTALKRKKNMCLNLMCRNLISDMKMRSYITGEDFKDYIFYRRNCSRQERLIINAMFCNNWFMHYLASIQDCEESKLINYKINNRNEKSNALQIFDVVIFNGTFYRSEVSWLLQTCGRHVPPDVISPRRFQDLQI